MKNNINKFLAFSGSFSMKNLKEAVYFSIILNKDDPILKNIFDLSQIKNISIDTFLEDLDKDINNNNDHRLEVLVRYPPQLSDFIVTWAYYAIYWVIDVSAEKNKTNDKYKIITRIALEFHFRYLLYKKNINEDDRVSEKTIEYAAIMVTRVIEYLSKISTYKNAYFTSLYFNKEIDNYLKNFIDVIANDYVESDCFIIKKDPDKDETYLKYENSYIDVSFQLIPSRKLNKGKDLDNKINKNHDLIENRKIVAYMLSGFKSYTKIVNLAYGRGKNKEVVTCNTLSDVHVTQSESLVKNQNIFENPEENIEENMRSSPRYRASLELENNKTIPDRRKQGLINIVSSANITKNNLLLNSTYNIPPIENMSIFLEHLVQKKFADSFLLDDLFVFVFIVGLSTGMSFQEVVEIIRYEKTKKYIIDYDKNRLKVVLDDKLFGKKLDNFFLTSSATITYELSIALIVMFKNMQHKIQCLEIEVQDGLVQYEKKYIKFMDQKMDSCPISISIDINNMWKIILTYQFKYGHQVSTLYCIGKYTTQVRSTLSYAAVHKLGQIHSRFLESIYGKMNIDFHINKLISIPFLNTWIIHKYDKKDESSGSKRIVDHEDTKKFFSLLHSSLLNEDDPVKYFNIYSVYARYALSILLATRSATESCKIKDITFELSLLRIMEKADNKLAAIRQIPLCKKAKVIIKKYKSLANQQNIATNNICFSFNGRQRIFNSKNKGLMIDLLRKYDVDNFIVDFVDTVPLNFGRHVVVKFPMKKKFDFYSLQALVGHYTKGAEQHGIISTLDEKVWRDSSIKLFDRIGKKYGI